MNDEQKAAMIDWMQGILDGLRNDTIQPISWKVENDLIDTHVSEAGIIQKRATGVQIYTLVILRLPARKT